MTSSDQSLREFPNRSSFGSERLRMPAAAKNILIVEDERDVIDLLTLNLRRAGGFNISTATDGIVGLQKARDEKPAFIILDLMLPGISGLELCKILKSERDTRDIPILMLTAKAEEIDRIVGLEFGADDYVTKPFSPREILLRIKAIIRRRAGESAEEKLSSGLITVDPSRYHVTVAGKPIRLTSVE